MATPGLLFASNGTTLFQMPGLVMEPAAAQWEHQIKWTSAFNLTGKTGLYGGRINRPLEVPMAIHSGWSTPGQRDSVLLGCEQYAGRKGTVTFANPAGTVTETWTNCVFVGLRVERRVYSPVTGHNYMALGVLMFDQIAS